MEDSLLSRVVCPRCGERGRVIREGYYSVCRVSRVEYLYEDGDCDLSAEPDEVDELLSSEQFRCGRCSYRFGDYSDTLLNYIEET